MRRVGTPGGFWSLIIPIFPQSRFDSACRFGHSNCVIRLRNPAGRFGPTLRSVKACRKHAVSSTSFASILEPSTRFWKLRPTPSEDFLKQRLGRYPHSKSMVATMVGPWRLGASDETCLHSVVTRAIIRLRIFHGNTYPYTLAVLQV